VHRTDDAIEVVLGEAPENGRGKARVIPSYGLTCVSDTVWIIVCEMKPIPINPLSRMTVGKYRQYYDELTLPNSCVASGREQGYREFHLG
jgi:hypothetical protein